VIQPLSHSQHSITFGQILCLDLNKSGCALLYSVPFFLQYYVNGQWIFTAAYGVNEHLSSVASFVHCHYEQLLEEIVCARVARLVAVSSQRWDLLCSSTLYCSTICCIVIRTKVHCFLRLEGWTKEDSMVCFFRRYTKSISVLSFNSLQDFDFPGLGVMEARAPINLPLVRQ